MTLIASSPSRLPRDMKVHAYLMARCSQFAYLREEDAKKQIEQLSELGPITDFHFINRRNQAFCIATDTDIVIVCRGTRPTNFADIAQDLKTILVPSPVGEGLVHWGFKDAVGKIWEDVLSWLSRTGHRDQTLTITGHSLGAAMATILALRLCKEIGHLPKPRYLFTFGSPRVGDDRFVRDLSNTGLEAYRFVNNADIVTRIPCWPCEHFSEPIYINHWGNVREMSWWQRTKDVFRGFLEGFVAFSNIFINDHLPSHYADRLWRWAEGTEFPEVPQPWC